MRSSFRASASDTCWVPRMCRFDFVVLPVRMWRLNALARMIFPVPVFLKRLAAPLCVFNFGISPSGRSERTRPPLLFGDRFRYGFLRTLRRGLPSRALAQDDVHLIAFLPRRRFGNRHVSQLANQPLQDAAADL